MNKIGIFLEGSPKMGGGFFQSLKSSLMLLDIEKYNSKMEVIITSKQTEDYFLKRNLKTILFGSNKIKSYFSELFEIDLIKELLIKLKIKHPFTSFIKKQKYDLVIFLGPSLMAKHCSGTSFIFNIWDLDHKKNTQFPEHNFNYTYEKKEKLLGEIIYRAFRIVVPHQANKNDLINLYKVKNEQVVNQNFIPLLPEIYKNNKLKDEDYKNIYNKLNLPSNKKIIFYPAQFWAHKNHKYIVDAAEILKKNLNKDYFFVFCGGDKGNYSYIKKLISEKQLEDYFKLFSFIDDNSLIAIYLNCNAVVMPTYCGPTNLPIYESFYFKKIIFYTKGLIQNDAINNHLVNIDINLPSDFCDKLTLCFKEEEVKKKVDENYKFYEEVCNEELFKKNYEKIFDEFSYISNRWS